MPPSRKGKEIEKTSQQEWEGYDEEDPKSDDWNPVEDPRQRRQIQNKLAQRKYREKVRNAKEESVRQSRDRAAAGNAYAQPNPQQLEQSSESSGVPWGSLNMRHIFERGQAQEQIAAQQRSRESSVYFSQASTQGLQTRTGDPATNYNAGQDPPSYSQGQQSTWASQPRPSGQGGTHNANVGTSQGSGGRGEGSYYR